MNLYNIFENKKTNEDFAGLMFGANNESNDLAGALVGDNGVSATLGTDNDRSPLSVTEQDEYGNQVTEHDEELDEAAMNPKVFAQAIEQGQAKGVLVGFEFETCIPKRSVEEWKRGPQPTAGAYNPTDLSWIEGKTVADVINGLTRVGRRNWGDNLNDLFKYKASVKTQTAFKSPWQHYTNWVAEKLAQIRNGADADRLTFEALSAFLKDPEVKAMEVNYMSDRAQAEFGDPAQYNGRTFALAVLKQDTGIDFSKRVPKAQLTPELARKVREASRKMYQWTRGPFDTAVNKIGNAAENHISKIENGFIPGRNYRAETTPESIASFTQHFAEFCRETMGTDNLKDLLKTKWAFNGRVNNTTETLKEKLWYYVTPGAEEPQSLRSRSYNSGGYMEGAEFLKANLKDVFGENMVIFRGYHQEAKKLDRWYIEPDGSLRGKDGDYTAEVVSPPLKAAEAMSALRTWYQKAEQLKLYTNNSTGLHINVSIPETLDVLKLAVFAGDQHVLKQFGREDNNYARSVIKSLKGKSNLPTVGSTEFKDAEKEMKDMVKSISGDHFATVNFNGKYVSFRHAGGDYLNKGKDIADTVGRFVRAMIIAADPRAYRDEYISKLVKMMKPGDAGQGDKLPLSDIRNIASKGIPTISTDIVVLPRSYDMPTEQDFADAKNAIQRWARDSYRVDAVITPDPEARARLLDSRGFGSQTKEWLQRAPENMFLRVTIYPTTRRSLQTFTDEYAHEGNGRGSAFGLYHDGKRAVGVKYRSLIKQDNPAFVTAMQALRGGAAKPLPLPGSKAASPTQASANQSGQPVTIGSGGDEYFEIYRMQDDQAVTMPDSRQLIVRADNRYEAERIGGQWLRDNAPSVNPRAYSVRPIEQPTSQQSGQQYGLWDVDGGGWVYTGNGRLEFDNEDAMRAWLVQHNRDENPNYEIRPISTGGQAQQDPNEERAYHLVNASGDMIQNYRGTLADTRRVAQSVAQRIGADVSIVDNGTTVDTVSPSDDTGNTGYRVTMSDGTPLGRVFDTEDEALDAAQELANARGQTYFVNDPDGDRVGGARPIEDDDSTTYGFVDLDSGERLATEEYASESEAMENAQELANNENISVAVYSGNHEIGRVSPQTDDEEDQQHTETGSYTLINNSGDRVADYVGSLEDAMNAAQYHANQTQMIVAVTLHGQILGSRRPEREQARSSDEHQENYIVTSISGRVMARGDSLNGMRALAQQAADRDRTTMELRGRDDNRLIATIQPSNSQTNEARIFHSDQKVNVLYSPHNSNAKVMLAKAVDQMFAQRVIDSYVARAAKNPAKQALSIKDFILQPIGHYTREDQYGGGFGGGSIAPVTDTTSPVGGSGLGVVAENDEDEVDYGGEYQAMVQRVGQKAREQEKKRPVDLAALAQRLRQGDEEVDEHIVKVGSQYRLVSKHGNKNLGTYPTKAGAEKRERQVQYFKHATEDEIMESYLYSMKKAGYDIL